MRETGSSERRAGRGGRVRLGLEEREQVDFRGMGVIQ